MPAVTPSEPEMASTGPDAPIDAAVVDGETEGSPVQLDAVGRARYLAEVMEEIDAEVRRRRASGDLPPGLERELDEMFLEFSPLGLQGKARLRETLALVDGSAYVDISVPVASQKKAGVYIKRLIRKSMGWYIGFIVHQLVKFAWSVSRMLHVVVDHVEVLESTIDALRPPELPAGSATVGDPGTAWWAEHARASLSATRGRVLHGECGNGSLVGLLVSAGVDAYGVDPAELMIEPAVDQGLDIRSESMLDHLEVVADEALDGIVLSGSLQWLHANERDRLIRMATGRLAIGGTLVLHSSTPEAWDRGVTALVADLAPGRPLHAETWTHLLSGLGVSTRAVHVGGDDRRLQRLDPSVPGADTVNAAVEVLNELLLGPGEFLLIAVRDR